ncbi:hypothetical protein PVK06_012567 [Gossypium arboreum]|uniref:Tf2-1-like SH3-like domain-containing protein n=1 Tax=Gossypium arboreum TaxID=29729 RepID=A0ABR0QCH5_GOSAR|nr:hypothetical protein PVK06_012567 [Gossypium arboreum]
MECFLCCGLHRMRDCLELSKTSANSKGNKVEPKSEALKFGSMILNSAKANRDRNWLGKDTSPFRVLKQVGRRAYKLELVTILKVKPVFNVKVPKPICEDQGDSNRGESQWGQVRVVDSCKRNVRKRSSSS